jgi:HlyD family secretion protein
MKNHFYAALASLIVLFAACGKKTQHTKPVRRDVTETVFASGVLEPEGKYNLTAQTDGYLVELKFDDGDTVKKDQVLAVIDNKSNDISSGSAGALLGLAARNASPDGPTLSQAQQSIRLLREKYLQDSVQYGRYQKLQQTNSVSKLELENARLAFESSKTGYLNAMQNYKLLKQQTEQQLIAQRSQSEVSSLLTGYNQLKAVFGGRIYKRLRQAGDFVRRGEIIAVIGSTDELFARLSVDESNISKVKVGQAVIVQLNTSKEKNYRGRVAEIYPAFDEQTQSFYCKVRFDEQPDFKVTGTQLQANIILAEKRNALVIPRNYLGFGEKVKVKDKGEVAVKTGFVSHEWVEISEGLSDDDEIITDNIK